MDVQPRMIPNPLWCEKCHGRGYVVYDAEWEPYAVQCDKCRKPVATFKRGDRVRKKKGAAWHGVVCGEYSTTLTPEGYAVESEREPGSVQIYPVDALTPLTD